MHMSASVKFNPWDMTFGWHSSTCGSVCVLKLTMISLRLATDTSPFSTPTLYTLLTSFSSTLMMPLKGTITNTLAAASAMHSMSTPSRGAWSTWTYSSATGLRTEPHNICLSLVMVSAALTAVICLVRSSTCISLRIAFRALVCSVVSGQSRADTVTGGKSLQSSLRNRTAGCRASYTTRVESGLGDHLYWVSCCMVCCRNAPKYLGTRSGETSLASAHASVGALEQGVPISNHSLCAGCSSLASAEYCRVLAL